MNRCFIIGNGPSQNNVDLTRLKDEITFGVNDIRLKFDTFMPTYWVIADAHYWGKYKEEITDWDNHSCIVYFIARNTGAYPKDRYRELSVFGNPSALRDGRVSFNGSKGNPNLYSIGNVCYIAMQLAWRMGFKELNTIGIDADKPRPRLDDHFTDNYGERLTDPNERGRGHELRSDIWTIGYKKAIDWIGKHDGTIWDVSDSPLNVFPKRSFDESLL